MSKQLDIYISDDEYFNVDILHKVLTGTDFVRKRSVNSELHGVPFGAMHPMDVLTSRLMNLYKLKEKQNDLGVAQFEMAIDVGRCYLRSMNNQNIIDSTFKAISIMALSDAGRKVAKRWNVHVADAIDPAFRKDDSSFIDIQLP